MVLRIRADDPKAKMQFGSKYGAGMKSVPRLLEVAKVLGLSVAGVSFHVGSGSMSPDAYDNAISAAKHVFTQVGGSCSVPCSSDPRLSIRVYTSWYPELCARFFPCIFSPPSVSRAHPAPPARLSPLATRRPRC